MFVRVSRRGRNRRPHLSFAETYRNEKGEPRQRIVESIGYLDDLEKEIPDALEHFRALARERTQAQKKEKTVPMMNVGVEYGKDEVVRARHLGHAPLKTLLGELGMPAFWSREQRKLDVDYSLQQVFLLLVADRFLDPHSKRGAFERRDALFEEFDFELHDVYRALRVFAELSSSLQAWLHAAVERLEGPHDETGYYDVTNFYFEIPCEDEDEVDENGKVVKEGLRKRGASKEHRRDPIVQMGLLMDSRGLPMAFHKYPGNRSEKTRMLPALGEIKRTHGLGRIVVVADRGLNTGTNTWSLAGRNDSDSEGHDGYIFAQTIRGADAEFREWAVSKDGWKTRKMVDRDGKEFELRYKSRVRMVDKKPNDRNGKPMKGATTCQKQIVTYSVKRATREAAQREAAVRKARALVADPARYNRTTMAGAAGYVRNLRFSKDTGEVVDGQLLEIDEERIRREARYDGYYSIVTSEIEMADTDVLDRHHGLWEIEESFRVCKSALRTRPMHVRHEDAIEAHMLVCFTTLLLVRLLERRLDPPVPLPRILEDLRSMACSYADAGYYLTHTHTPVTHAIGEAFGYLWNKKFLTRGEIRNILKWGVPKERNTT